MMKNSAVAHLKVESYFFYLQIFQNCNWIQASLSSKYHPKIDVRENLI